MEKEIIAKWQSKMGKYWVHLLKDDLGYFYHCDDGGGSFGNVFDTDDDAIQYMDKYVKHVLTGPSQLRRV